jgi:uncharacterized protein (DUF1697 family)
MTIHAGLLRAVNLAGHNKVAMSDLRDLLVTLGFQDGRSLLQSGNIVFRCTHSSTEKIERLLEAGADEHLGLKTDFFVRNAKEIAAVIANNPFPAEARSDPGHLIVMFLRHEPERAAVAALQKAIVGREVVRAKGPHAYIYYPDGIGRSKLTVALIEKKLGGRGTGRNWNTVMKLNALMEPA